MSDYQGMAPGPQGLRGSGLPGAGLIWELVGLGIVCLVTLIILGLAVYGLLALGNAV